MAVQKLVLEAKVGAMMGLPLKIATINLLQQATEPELSDWTQLMCPQDFKKPKYIPARYECDCGFKAGHWSALARVINGTRKLLEIPKLTKGNGEVEHAQVSCMPFEEFVKQGYIDALPKEDAERPIKAADDESRDNLFKLLTAQEIDKTAIIVKWNDTKEQKIALLATTPSGKIVLRRVIPSNLVQIKEAGMYLDKTQFNPPHNHADAKDCTEKCPNFRAKQDLEQARQFLKEYIPKANPKTFEVDDYRVQAIKIEATTRATSAPAKQQAMAELLQVARAKKKEKKA